MFEAVNNFLLHKVEIGQNGNATLIWEKFNFPEPITVTNEIPGPPSDTAVFIGRTETKAISPNKEPKVSKTSGEQQLTKRPKQDGQFRFEALPGAESASLTRRSAVMLFLPPDYTVFLDQPSGKALGLDKVYTGHYAEPKSGRLSIVVTTLIGFAIGNENTSTYGCSYNVILNPTSAANNLAEATKHKNSFLSDWGFSITCRQAEQLSQRNTAGSYVLGATGTAATILPILYGMIQNHLP